MFTNFSERQRQRQKKDQKTVDTKLKSRRKTPETETCTNLNCQKLINKISSRVGVSKIPK